MPDTHRMPSDNLGRISAFHVFVVSLSLTLTIGAWQFSKNQVETRTENRFQASRDRAVGLIIDRMQKYEDALWAGVAAVESHGGDISYRDWRRFAHTLRIDEKYPGINGIGVIHFHSDQTLGDYLSAQRSERPDFRVFPEHDQPLYMPITFVEPEEVNAAAIGLDVAHELNRRTAALASRDTGTAQITGPIILVQDADSTPGFLFYAPFYRDGIPLELAERQDRIIGTVYAPFVVHKLMEGLLAKELRDVRFSISDGGSLIYDEHFVEDESYDPNPMFSDEISLDIYGRSWRLDIRTNKVFRQQNTYAQPLVILLAGLLIEALIIALLLLMSRANSKAIRYADQVTAALKKESIDLAATNAELSDKNDEMEHFVYVASHDLKTPIRGIGGLTEMIEEDLEEYLASPNANPEVRKNLDHIHNRVRRMNQLTQGILEYSKIGTKDRVSEPIKLQDVIEAMVFDFGLKEDQLRLSGNVEYVSVDTFVFRRVLENLVGNAVKYHNKTEKLKIDVNAENDGDWCLISVKDNGPGIDPRYHDKIFKFFQTLRTSDMPESTGIGLSIVKKAVELHGGEITLESVLGEGCSFAFTWPAKNKVKATKAIRSAA